MGAKKVEPRHADECILFETHMDYCREEKTVASGQNLGACRVVGKVSLSEKFAAYDNGASDGTQAAAGILLSAVNAEDGDQKGAVLVRGPAILKDAMVDWGDSDDAAIAAGKTDLEALGIIIQR